MNAAVEVPEETAAAVDAATANSTVGPESAEACSTHVASHAGAAFFCRELQSRLPSGSDEPLRLLVAGCGAGHEAAYIRMSFHCTVDAVDIELYADEHLRAIEGLNIGVGSVTDLPFADNTFSAVFYHHVIEHVDDPPRSLAEIHRVLRPGGWLFIGTPNRQRVVSAIGAHQQTDWESTWRNKLRENLQDWSARLRGRFRNEFGAHAGFSKSELDQLLAKHFPRRDWLTSQYLRFKYGRSRFAPLLPVVTCPPVRTFAAPGIYVMSQKGPAS
ncbi:MAG: class I SAM-dependent methyltransferase [Pirellulaceae bacterium]